MNDDWDIYFTGTEEAVVTANAQINSNCGFPDSCTEGWATPQQAYEQDFWFILMPPPDGYTTKCGSWTQEEMISDVTGVEEQQAESNWWPPNPFPPESE